MADAMADYRAAKVFDAFTAILSLAEASGLEHEAIIDCLNHATASVLTWLVIAGSEDPDDMPDIVATYHQTLLGRTMRLLQAHGDTI